MIFWGRRPKEAIFRFNLKMFQTEIKRQAEQVGAHAYKDITLFRNTSPEAEVLAMANKRSVGCLPGKQL